MKTAHFYLIAILFHHLAGSMLYTAYLWCCVPGGEWMRSSVIYWVPLIVLLYFWLRADAKDRSIEISTWVSVLVPPLFPVGVPFYFWRTNQSRVAAMRTGLALLFVGACIAAVFLGTWLTNQYYGVWTNPTTPPPNISLERTRDR
jgi:hypothetical protein